MCVRNPAGKLHRTEALLGLAACTPIRAFNHTPEELREGFRVGYDYQKSVTKQKSGNMRSGEEHRGVVEEYIHKELAAGRLRGPYDVSRFPMVHSSPFGVIPKSEVCKWRLIIDLSAPIGSSMNDGINKDLCSLTYLSIDSVAEKVAQYGVGCLLAKFDLKVAYRNIPVHPDDRHLLGLQWDNSLYIDTCLPFGLRSAPMIFTAVADALAFIIGLRIKSWLDHCLDDFVILGPADSDQCQRDLLAGLEVCSRLGFPVAEDKTFGPATTLTLLGIEIDSVVGELRLPFDMLTKLRLLVAKWRSRKACTKGNCSRWRVT